VRPLSGPSTQALPAGKGGGVTGASNVTGEMPPIDRIARLAHQAGAWFVLDATQLIPHGPVRMGAPDDPERIDFLAFSGHETYAPFGCGVPAGHREVFRQGAPDEVGGGTVHAVMLEEVMWHGLPEREEAGTPNVNGAVALARAAQVLQAMGMEQVAVHEQDMTRYCLERLLRIDGLRLFGGRDATPAVDRNPVFAVQAEGLGHGVLAAALGHEWGIGVRNGCFCAQPYVRELLGIPPDEMRRIVHRLAAGDHTTVPGLLRISLGIYNTREEVDYVAEALGSLIAHGARLEYRLDPQHLDYWTFNVEVRCWPILPIILIGAMCPVRRIEMNKKYIVRLTDQERQELKDLVSKGRAAAYKIRHANILLLADADGPGWTDERIAEAVSVHPCTVANVRMRLVERGVEGALARKKQDRPSREPLLDGQKEARLIALACSEPPEGRTRWTLHLLADKMVELKVVESISHETVRKGLKKRTQAPPAPVLVHPPEAERRLRSGHGGRAGPLLRALPGEAAGDLHGRTASTTRQGEPACAPRRTGPAGAIRLRIRAGRDRKPVSFLRAAGGVAPCRCHPEEDPRGLGAPGLPVCVRRTGRADSPGAGQPEHP